GKGALWSIKQIAELENVHGKRRDWVWADLGQAPLAAALKHLVTMAEICGKQVSGGSLEDLVSAHLDKGWCADAAMTDAMTLLEKRDDIEAVQSFIRAVYLPWLEQCAVAFQKLVRPDCTAI